MCKWLRAAAITAAMSFGLLAPVLAGEGTAWAGVSLADFCDD
jgi:hypothetical protein